MPAHPATVAAYLVDAADTMTVDGLECCDIRRDRLDGAHVRIRKSKTDQDGTGAVKALPFTTL